MAQTVSVYKRQMLKGLDSCRKAKNFKKTTERLSL